MARTISEVKNIAQDTIALLNKYITIEAAYVFGSYIEGTQNEFSDIDIAVFSSSLNTIDIEQKMEIIVQTEKQINKEIELHLFKSKYLKEARPTNIYGYILQHGLQIA